MYTDYSPYTTSGKMEREGLTGRKSLPSWEVQCKKQFPKTMKRVPQGGHNQNCCQSKNLNQTDNQRYSSQKLNQSNNHQSIMQN